MLSCTKVTNWQRNIYVTQQALVVQKWTLSDTIRCVRNSSLLSFHSATFFQITNHCNSLLLTLLSLVKSSHPHLSLPFPSLSLSLFPSVSLFSVLSKQNKCERVKTKEAKHYHSTRTHLNLPEVGFKAHTPQKLAGARTLPPTSVPSPMMEPPAPNAAPSPPDDPPGVRLLLWGLSVEPKMEFIQA